MPEILGSVGRALGSGLGLLRDQIGYEWNQLRGGLGALGRGDIGGAIRSGMAMHGQGPLYDALGSLGQSRSERLGVERPARPARQGSVVQQGRVGDSYRPSVSGIPEPRSRVDREMGAIATAVGRTEGAGSTDEWLGQEGSRGGRDGRGGGGSLLRNEAGATGRYGGAGRLGTGQGLESSLHMRDMIERQHRRQNQEY